jgi:two-component system, NarL family, nitrate/nitrite sensor histidine kinase NarX
VRDDGVGFDPAERASGTGLSSMRARVEALGGRLHLDARPGGGTCVTLTVSCR